MVTRPLPAVVTKYKTVFGSAETRELRGHGDKVNGIGWNCEGRRAASSSADKSVRVWSLERMSSAAELRGHQGVVQQLVWDPTHPDKLATASVDRTVRVWDVRAPRAAAQSISTKGENLNISWSPDGHHIAVGNKDDLISFIDVRGGTGADDKKPFIWHTMPNETEINEISWNYAGDLFFLTTGEGTVRIVEFPSFKHVYNLAAHTANTFCIDFDPRGRFFATGSNDATVTVWEMDTFASVQTMERLDNQIRTISFSHDGEFIASGSEDKCIDIAHAETGELVYSVKTTAALNAVAWHPNKHLLLYATDESNHNTRSSGLQIFGFSRGSG
ncbi:WD40-repeat-containing domain protein [Entophlyctis helioformis]|nr:WD40-repeat-containing domain protein [Entophlyctis helioformis]